MSDGGPAFPVISTQERDSSIYQDTTFADVSSVGGMSLRDYFAAKAMQGLLAANTSGGAGFVNLNGKRTEFQEAAYILADSMLAQRAKTTL